MYKLFQLVNGVRCVGLDVGDRDSLSLGIWIKVGGRHEPEQKCGISHFLEHLLFKGTTKRSAQKIKTEIEGKGGSINGFTTEEFTCYPVKVLHRDIGVALDVLSDMVLRARLSSDDIEKERTVVIEEINMYKDLPTCYVHELVSGLLWPEDALGRSLAGSVETVSSISRNDLVDYRDRFYNPSNIVISACGKMECNKFFGYCERYFKGVEAGPNSKFDSARQGQQAPRLKVMFKETEQTHLSLGMHTFGRSDHDRYTLSLLNIILGGNMSSRLFRQLRERRGLVYEIGTFLKRFQDTGAFVVSAGLDNEKAPKSIELILKELRKIRDKSVTRDELGRAKKFYRGQLLLALEDTSDHMLWMGEHMVMEEKIPPARDILEEIDKVSQDDVMRVAGRVFKDSHLNLALIGPVDEKAEKKIEGILTVK